MEGTVQTRAQKEADQLEEHIGLIRELRGLNILDVTGYVYRILRQDRNRRTACGKVFDVLEDDDFGRQFGPGIYQVAYHADLSDGSKKVKTLTYDIGKEYFPLHKEYCQENGIPFQELDQRGAGAQPSTLAGLLDKEKVESIFTLVGGLKALLAPAQGQQIDQLQMLKVMAEIMPKPQPIQDVFIQEAFKSLRKENISPLAGIKEQLDLFGQMREVFATPEEKAAAVEYDRQQKETPMDKLISIAIEALPAFMDRFGGSIPQAAAALQREKPIQVRMLKSSQNLQAAAYQKIAESQGVEAANQWAKSLGMYAGIRQENQGSSANLKPAAGVITL